MFSVILCTVTKGMFTKTMLLFLGYIINICRTTKEDLYPFNYTNMTVKESCNNWFWKLGFYEQTLSFSTSRRLAKYSSHENSFNKHIILQTNSRQHNLAGSGLTFNIISLEQDLDGNLIEKASLSALIKSMFNLDKTKAIGDFSRANMIEMLPAVGKGKVNFTGLLLSYLSCVKVKEYVNVLFMWSAKLLDYVGSRKCSTQIILHGAAARFMDRKIFSIISSVTNTFNVIEQIFCNCNLSQGKETIMLTKHSFLWFKVDEPYRFQNLSDEFQKRSSFFRITSQLQEDLAKKPSLISVQFMNTENLVRFSYNNFISVSHLMLLSIKREGNHFTNLSVPIDLFFKYKINARSKHLFQGSINIPPNNESILDKDKLVTVYKLIPFHFPGSGKIVVRFYNLNMNSLKVAISINLRPDWETMTSHSTVITMKSPTYEATLENQTKDSINYLGITYASTVSRTIDYIFEARYFQCYSKFGKEWKSDGCEVGAETNETIIHCQCKHLSLFGGGVAIAPRQIDFGQDIQFLLLVHENPNPCILVSSIILIYLIILVWTRHNDRKDRLQRFVVVLDDNFPGEEWPYLMAVYTSFWIGSGTEAKVGIRLYGTKGISRIHVLNMVGQRKVLKSNCDDWFLIFAPKNLGEIEKIHIFSDFTGYNPDWYCRKIMLYDLEGQKEFKFVIEKWVSLAEDDECVEFFCYPTPTKKNLRRDRIALDNIIFGLQETHLLFSIFTRHPRSSVTRSQRLSVCICILLVHLLTSNIFHESELPESPQYSETKRKLVIQMESTLVASPFTFIVIFCFKKSRIITVPKNDVPMTLTSTQAVPLETGLVFNQDRKQASEKLTGKENQPTESNRSSEEDSDETEEETEEEEAEEEEVEGEEEVQEVEEGCFKNCFNQIRALIFQVIVSKTIMPVKIAEEDEKSARIRIKWMYFAWLLCEFAIFGSAFFVILYSLKMKPEICSEWMHSSMKYSLTNIFFMAPLKITVFALILAGLYGQLHYIPSYECNTEAAVKRKMIGNKKFLSKLLRIRKHKCYKPLNSKNTQEIRIKEKNYRRWRILINFLVTVFLYVLLMIIVETSWPGLYLQTKKHYENMFNPRVGHKPITNFNTYIDYLTKVVIPAYDKVSWYNGARVMTQEIWKQESNFLKDYLTRLVGVPRIRQQRVKAEACVVPRIMVDKLNFQQCYAPITWSNIDKKSYTVSWTRPELLVEDSNSPWVFSNHKNSHLIICGHNTAKCYMAGGYTAKLSVKDEESESLVNELRTEEWFDGLTRVLFFETVVYNVNSDIISSVVPMMEKLADGSVFIHITVTSLHPTADGFIENFLTLLILTSYYIIRIVLIFNRKGLKYILSGTGMLDIFISMTLYATMISLFFNRDARSEYLHNWQLQEENDLQITKDIFLHRSLITYETGVTLLLLSIQFLHNFRFGKRYFVYFKTLSYCSKYALGITFVIAMFYTCFVLLSAINISKPAKCLLNRIYNPISYCTGIYSLSSNVEWFALIVWFMANIATFVACITIIYGYRWMKEQNKYVQDFNIGPFMLEKLKQASKKTSKMLFRAKAEVISLSHKRLRAGADTVIDAEEEDVHPRNIPLTYTKIRLNEMNMKLDTILGKLTDLNKSV